MHDKQKTSKENEKPLERGDTNEVVLGIAVKRIHPIDSWSAEVS